MSNLLTWNEKQILTGSKSPFGLSYFGTSNKLNKKGDLIAIGASASCQDLIFKLRDLKDGRIYSGSLNNLQISENVEINIEDFGSRSSSFSYYEIFVNGQSLITTSNKYILNNLNPSQNYCFKVRAVCDSDLNSCQDLTLQVFDTKSGRIYNGTQNNIELSDTFQILLIDSPRRSNLFNFYEIYLNGETVTTNTNTYTVKNAYGAQNYCIKARAVCGGSSSSSAKVNYCGDIDLNLIDNGNVYSGNTSINVSDTFSIVGNVKNGTASLYEISVNGNTQIVSNPNYLFKNLAPNQTYCIKIRTVCEDLDSCQDLTMTLSDGINTYSGNILNYVAVGKTFTISASKSGVGNLSVYGYELYVNGTSIIIYSPVYVFNANIGEQYCIKIRAICNPISSSSSSYSTTIGDVYCPPEIIGNLNIVGQAGDQFIYKIEITNKTCCKHTIYSGENLPEGLSLDKDTGIIYGIPTENGLFQIPISAKNKDGVSNKILNITFKPGLISKERIYLKINETFEFKFNTSQNPSFYLFENLPLNIKANSALGIISGLALEEYNNKTFVVKAYYGTNIHTKEFKFKIINDYYHRRYKMFILAIGAYHDNYKYILPDNLLTPLSIPPQFSFKISSSLSSSYSNTSGSSNITTTTPAPSASSRSSSSSRSLTNTTTTTPAPSSSRSSSSSRISSSSSDISSSSSFNRYSGISCRSKNSTDVESSTSREVCENDTLEGFLVEAIYVHDPLLGPGICDSQVSCPTGGGYDTYYDSSSSKYCCCHCEDPNNQCRCSDETEYPCCPPGDTME
jgi:hypothetical protein